MNIDDIYPALERVGNPNILVNFVSRRVRQLSTSGGKNNRPLLSETGTMGYADIALAELLNDKMEWEFEEEENPLIEEYGHKPE